MDDARQISIDLANWPEGPAETPLVTAVAQVPDEITPEIVAVVQAAVNEFLGRRVRIVSIRLPRTSYGDPDVWLQRGRDTIQASHNLVQQRH
jgi:hypothetical protein